MGYYSGGGHGRVITKYTIDDRGILEIRPEEYLDTHYSFRGYGNTERIAAEAVRVSGMAAMEIGKAQQYAIKNVRPSYY